MFAMEAITKSRKQALLRRALDQAELKPQTREERIQVLKDVQIQ
jgi:hypothetical protein